MRKRPMCLACLGFMLVLVLLQIAGVPLGTPFSDPKYELSLIHISEPTRH